MEDAVKIRDFAYPMNDPRHWGLALPQEDTPPNSDSDFNEADSQESEDEGDDWTTSSEDEDKTLQIGVSSIEDSEPLSVLKSDEDAVGDDVDSPDTPVQTDDDIDENGKTDSSKKESTECTGWFFGQSTNDTDEYTASVDQLLLQELSVSDDATQKDLSSVFIKFKVDVLDVLSFVLNRHRLDAVSSKSPIPESAETEKEPQICFRKAQVQYEFRKISDWEMTINEGEHILVALRHEPEPEAATPTNDSAEKSGENELEKAPKAELPAKSLSPTAGGDREASIDDLSEVNSYHKGKLHALRSVGSLLDVLYSENRSKSGVTTSRTKLSASEIGLSRHSLALSPFKSDLARSYNPQRYVDVLSSSSKSATKASKSLSNLAAVADDSNPTSPVSLSGRSPGTSPTTGIPQRRSSLNGPVEFAAQSSGNKFLLNSDVLQSTTLHIEKADLIALFFHAKIQWDIKVQPNKPEKLRKHLVEYLDYQKEYGDGWITALRVSWKWKVYRNTASQPGSPSSFTPDYVLKTRIKISEMGLVPGNYIHTF